MPSEFVGRDVELADAWACIQNQGDSLMIVSELPHGRTSLLRRLEARLRAGGRRTLFIDLFGLPAEIEPAAVWSRVETKLGVDLQRSFGGGGSDPPVLIVDDFHEIVRRRRLCTPEFLGTLRSLTSMRALKFVGASACDLVALGRGLGEAWGSPFLNTHREQRLGPLRSRDVEQVLGLVGEEFSDSDRGFIARCTGGQPKLLNLLASGVLKINRVGRSEQARASRWKQALQELRSELGHLLRNIWGRIASVERWCLLNICVGSACLTAIPSGELLEERRDPVAVTEQQRSAAVVRFFQRLPRTTLKQAVRGVLGEDAVAHLPSDMQTDATFAAETEAYLRRCFCVGEVLADLRRRDEVPQDELRELVALREAPKLPSPAAFEVAIDQLVEKGLIQTSLAPPGWEIRPILLTGWLRDHVRAPDLLRKLVVAKEDNFDFGVIETFVRGHSKVFAPGGMSCFEELYHED